MGKFENLIVIIVVVLIIILIPFVTEIIKNKSEESRARNYKELNDKAEKLYYKRNYKEALEVYNGMLSYSNCSESLVLTNYHIGVIHFELKNYETAIAYFNYILSNEEYTNLQIHCKIYEYFGDILVIREKYEDAITSYNYTLNLATQMESSSTCRLYSIYCAMAEAYFHKNDFEKALEVVELALQNFDKDVDVDEEIALNIKNHCDTLLRRNWNFIKELPKKIKTKLVPSIREEPIEILALPPINYGNYQFNSICEVSSELSALPPINIGNNQPQFNSLSEVPSELSALPPIITNNELVPYSSKRERPDEPNAFRKTLAPPSKENESLFSDVTILGTNNRKSDYRISSKTFDKLDKDSEQYIIAGIGFIICLIAIVFCLAHKNRKLAKFINDTLNDQEELNFSIINMEGKKCEDCLRKVNELFRDSEGLLAKIPRLLAKISLRSVDFEEFIKDARDHAKKTLNDLINPKLNLEEAIAVAAYSIESDFYGKINSTLRERDERKNKILRGYVSILCSALKKLDTYEKRVYRGIKNKPKDFDKYKEGAVVTWAAFTSSSRNKKEAIKFAGKGGILLEIKSKFGKNIEDYSTIGKEEEVLFTINTTLKVTKVTKEERIEGIEGIEAIDTIYLEEFKIEKN